VLVVSPWRAIQLPKVERSPVVPLAVTQVVQIADRIVPQLRAAVLFGAATGLRQGELFGLTVDRVDFLGRRARVDRQLLAAPGVVPQFGPPKSAASYRTVPLPDVALEALAAHLGAWPRGRDELLFQTDRGAPIIRNRAADAWRSSAAGLALAPRSGWHALRHHYASVLIAGGESVKVVQSRLGHATAEETLNTYAHLWPDSEDRTRSVVDAAFRDDETSSIGLEG
jgi:integrase